jgi:exosortase
MQGVSSTTSQTPAVFSSSETRSAGWSAQGKMLVALGAAAFLALFFRFFLRQGQFSLEYLDDWGHAFVIPLISGFLIYRERAKLFTTAIEPFWPGLLPLLLGIVTYFFFVLGVSNHMLQGAAMLLALSGMVLLSCGLGVFRVVFLPIAFLCFGITISEQVMIKATFPLQLLATKGGKWYMVDADGNTLTMYYKGRQIPLNVAEACSGMRMVIAFVALAGAVALLSVHEWWKRVAVVMLSVPVALFMNIIRVCVLALASLYDNNLASGNVLLLPGLGLFLAAVWALDRIVKNEPTALKASAPKAKAGGA